MVGYLAEWLADLMVELTADCWVEVTVDCLVAQTVVRLAESWAGSSVDLKATSSAGWTAENLAVRTV